MRPRVLLSLSLLVLTIALLAPQASLAQYDISTVAGGGPTGLTAVKSSIGSPLSVGRDSFGNTYVLDFYSNRVFKVDTSNNLTVAAGNGAVGYSGDGGPATSAALNGPEGIFVDAAGDIFIADTGNSVIREVTASTGNITTVAGNGTACSDSTSSCGDGGVATAAELADPFGVFVDASGNIFIADTSDERIRKVVSGTIQTVAGNGAFCQDPTTPCGDGAAATGAQLDFPEGVFVDANGNIFIADTDNNRIRVVNPSAAPVMIAGVTIPAAAIATVAGAYYNSEGGTGGDCKTTPDGGLATAAYICQPGNVFVDSPEDIFIADTGNEVVREVVASTIQTVAGIPGTAGFSPDGTLAKSANLDEPNDIFVDTAGDIFIVDTGNAVVREVTASTGDIATVIGNNFESYAGDGGAAIDAQLNYPGGVFVDGSGNIFIADTINSVIREVAAASGDIQTMAGDGSVCASATAPPPVCGNDGLALSAQLNNPSGLFVDASGNIFIADTEDNLIRVVNTGAAAITVATVPVGPGEIATVAGNGTQGYAGDGAAAISAELNAPFGVFVDPSGNIFIADTSNNVIREVTATTGAITTVAGNGTNCAQPTNPCGDGGAAISAQLSFPTNVFVDSAQNIYIGDKGDNRIRAVNTSTQPATVASIVIPPGDIATVAGTGARGYAGDGAAATSALLNAPYGVFVDSSGDIFLSDPENFVVREVVASTGFIATVAGNNIQGFSGDTGSSTAAELNWPTSIFGDASGNLYVADTDNSRIRKLVVAATTAPPSAPAPAPQTASPGGTATYSIRLSANTGNPKYPITLSCLQSSLPSGATCSFSPATITPGPAPVPFTLTVSVPTSSAVLEKAGKSRPELLFAFASLPLVGILFAISDRRNKQCRWWWLAGLFVVVVLLNACGGGSSGSGSSTGGTQYSVQIRGTTTAQPTPVTITTATLTVQ